MDNASLERIGITLANISALIAEHVRHKGQASAFDLGEMLEPEVLRLSQEGQGALADAIVSLGKEGGQ